MNAKHLLISSLATCGLLTGCLSEPEFEPVVEGSGIEISLDGSIKQVATKATAEGFETGDALGLYAVNYENGNQTPGTLLAEGNQADHVKYIFNFENWQWTPVKKVYYKDVNTNVDLYVFYPHAEPESIEAYNFEVQKDQSKAKTQTALGGYEASDFLWAKVENVAPTEGKIKVQLDHKMAGIHVVLAEGTGFEEGEFALIAKSVLATGVTRKASINMATGAVIPVGDAQATGIVMCPQTDGSFRAVVAPQTVAAQTSLFSITVEGLTYKFRKDADFTYEAGKVNKFTIKINRKTPTGEYELDLVESTIVPWTEDLNVHEGEARQYYCVSQDNPGTLGQILRSQKKDRNKIKNLKVSGKIDATDFAFMRDSMSNLQAVNLKEATICNAWQAEVYISGGTRYVWMSGTRPETAEEQKAKIQERFGYDYNGKATTTTSPANEIPSGAFSGKQYLRSFVFPEYVTKIRESAFSGCSLLSGALIIPDDVTEIEKGAFNSCSNLTSLTLPNKLERIGYTTGSYSASYGGTFYNCKNLSGSLNLPSSLTYIGMYSFYGCEGLTGNLVLNDEIQYIGSGAFRGCTGFTGDLKIPESITFLDGETFYGCTGLKGQLIMHDNLEISNNEFWNCKFQGELKLPSLLREIPKGCFYGCEFTSIANFPDELLSIGDNAFYECWRLEGVLEFPETLVKLGERAFYKCRNLQGIILPPELGVINSYVFSDCFYLSKIVCKSIEPPVISTSTFSGVAKDNFTVEVPSQSINKYISDIKWGEFKRIGAYYDFSISRREMRTLKKEHCRDFTLRAPAKHSWSVKSCPEWVTVEPLSGTGKTEVTITVKEMTPSEVQTFDVVSGPYNNQKTTTYKGRGGDVIFQLDDKNQTVNLKIEQYDSEHYDGEVISNHLATKGNGVNIVFIGDCFDAQDIATGKYMSGINEAIGHYFDIEPYKTYKDYFNIYSVVGLSNDSGMGTVNTIRDAKFGSQYSLEGIAPDFETCYEYALKANSNIIPGKTLLVLVENTTDYGGICYMWGDGSAIAVCPMSADAYPYDFRGIVQHEAGGHGFGKLADEYIYHNQFISSCTCTCCPHYSSLFNGKAIGWYRNLELTGDMNEVGWSHLIFHPKYSNIVDIYEGGYYVTRGVYRSEPTSCMNNNIPYYSAISRQAMVERIMEYAGEEFDLDTFIAKDITTAGPTTKSAFEVMPIVEPVYNNGKQHAPVYMGDKPNFRK